jgi:hypothetical protein
VYTVSTDSILTDTQTAYTWTTDSILTDNRLTDAADRIYCAKSQQTAYSQSQQTAYTWTTDSMHKDTQKAYTQTTDSIPIGTQTDTQEPRTAYS